MRFLLKKQPLHPDHCAVSVLASRILLRDSSCGLRWRAGIFELKGRLPECAARGYLQVWIDGSLTPSLRWECIGVPAPCVLQSFTMTPAAPGARRFPDRAWRCRRLNVQASRCGIAPCGSYWRLSCPAHTAWVYDERRPDRNLRQGWDARSGLPLWGAGPIAVRLRCRYLLSQILGLAQRSWSPVLAAWIYDDTHEVAMTRYPWNWPPLGR